MKNTIRKKLVTLSLAFVMAFTIMPSTNALAIVVDLKATSYEEKMPIGLSQEIYYRIRNAQTNQYLTSDKYGSLKLVDKKQAVKTENSQFLIIRYGNNKYRILSKTRNYLSLYNTRAGSISKSSINSLTTVAQNSTYFNITRGHIDSAASGLYYINSAINNYAIVPSSPYVVGKYVYNNDLNSAWAFEQVAEHRNSQILYSTQTNNKLEAIKAEMATNSVKAWANSTSKNITAYAPPSGVNIPNYLKQMESATNITSFGHAGQCGYYITPNDQITFATSHKANCLSQCKLAIIAGCESASEWNRGNICKNLYKAGAHTVIGFTKTTDLETGAMYVKYFYEYAKLNDFATVAECHNYAIVNTNLNAPSINKRFSKGEIPSFSNTKICGDKNALVNY